MKLLLPLCSIPKIATRDGGTGPLARLFLPFLGAYWFASGQQYSFPSSTIPQNLSPTSMGLTGPDTFVKDAQVCLQPL